LGLSAEFVNHLAMFFSHNSHSISAKRTTSGDQWHREAAHEKKGKKSRMQDIYMTREMAMLLPML
jgi:hypothetical protein